MKTTPKGIQYIVVKEGSGKSPKKPEDSVTVKYTGTLITGEVFDSSERTGKPAEFKIGQVIPGFQDGLMHMKEGGIYKFFIPPNLGYGATDRPGIPPQSVLIFEVELIKVK